MLKTLRARLIAGYLGVLLIGLLLAGGAFIVLMLRVQNDLVYRSLATNAPLILPQIREARTGGGPRLLLTLRDELRQTRLRVLGLSTDNTVVLDTAQGPTALVSAVLTLNPVAVDTPNVPP